MSKARIFSGVQPSGNLHIGNYLGAISQWAEMQDKYESIFCVVDYHAITVPQDPKALKEKIIEIAKIYLASGIDPKKSVIFQQSDIKEHAELGWVLNTICRMSDLLRMTQFKDKSGALTDYVNFDTISFERKDNESDEEYMRNIIKKHSGGKSLNDLELVNLGMDIFRDIIINVMGLLNKTGVGLFDYPALMAADILLYNTDVVPVGDDQVQHVELARDLAKRFNHSYGETFKVPKAVIRKEGARIMGLDDPTKKMSKSAPSENNYIALTDDPDKAVKKIMKATTDSGTEVTYDPVKKPGVSNLLVIQSLLTKKGIKDLVKEQEGKMYGDFKKAVAEDVKAFLIDFQSRYNKISNNDVRNIMKHGAEKIRPIAEETINRVKEKIGVK